MRMNRFLTGVGLATLAAAASASNLGIGDPAPPITVAKWVQGTPVKNGPGGLRVVEFWATWCPPCKESIPHLTELSKKFKGKVTFTGVDVFENSPDDISTVQKFLKTMGPKMAYNIAVDKAGVMANSWMNAAHQGGIPTAFVVDKAGTVVWIGHPMMGLEEALTQLIAGKYDVKKEKSKFLADMNAQKAAEQKEEASDSFGRAIKSASDLYQNGKKKEAMTAFDKISPPSSDAKLEILMAKFSLLNTDDKPGAHALLDKAADTNKEPHMAYLLTACALSLTTNPKSTADDKTYGLTLAEKALKAAPTDPLIEFQLAMLYDKSSQSEKSTSLLKDALKNVANAPSQYQEQLKTMIAKKLSEVKTVEPQTNSAPVKS